MNDIITAENITSRKEVLDAGYKAWRETANGRIIFQLAYSRALLLRTKGMRRYSIKGILEAIRFDRAADYGSDEGYRINNNRSSRLARDLMDNDSRLVGFFETRTLSEATCLQ